MRWDLLNIRSLYFMSLLSKIGAIGTNTRLSCEVNRLFHQVFIKYNLSSPATSVSYYICHKENAKKMQIPSDRLVTWDKTCDFICSLISLFLN